MSDESCPICKRELHSIITRRLGEIAVCITCGDAIIPIVNAIAEDLVERATIATNTGITVESIIPFLCQDYGLSQEAIDKICPGTILIKDKIST